MASAFHLTRQSRGQRARTLGMLLVELDGDYRIDLRRAPDVRQACEEAYAQTIVVYGVEEPRNPPRDIRSWVC